MNQPLTLILSEVRSEPVESNNRWIRYDIGFGETLGASSVTCRTIPGEELSKIVGLSAQEQRDFLFKQFGIIATAATWDAKKGPTYYRVNADVHKILDVKKEIYAKNHGNVIASMSPDKINEISGIVAGKYNNNNNQVIQK